MISFFKSVIGLSTVAQVALAAITLPTLPKLATNDSLVQHPKRENEPTYKLSEKHHGDSFFDGWDFWDQPDPTHGHVNYLAQPDAIAKNLTYTQPDGTVVIAVDDYTQLQDGQKRNSVRVSSKRKYSGGLFILDAFSMPHGCSVWPAWWTVGPNWPSGGEIDIVEGVHENTNNQYTLHTSAGCSLNRNPPLPSTISANANLKPFTGNVKETKCEVKGGDNTGCAFMDTNTSSYGHGFNMIAGGVFAMLWNDEGISIWHFPRGSIPSDIDSLKPDPSGWSSPAAFWSSSTCTTKKFFQDHVMVIDTTLCGDWAGATYSSAGCPAGSCQAFVKDPKNFEFARWKINYIATYDLA